MGSGASSPPWPPTLPSHAGAVVTSPGKGYGIAVCPTLRRLVTSSTVDDTLSVYEIAVDGTFPLLRVLGGTGTGRLQFRFGDRDEDDRTDWSGWMCFTQPASEGGKPPTLLVADMANEKVEEVDVVEMSSVGLLFPPESRLPARAVAANRAHIAVSVWYSDSDVMPINPYFRGEDLHRVHVWDAVSRAPLRILGRGWGSGPGQLRKPCGLRLSRDGQHAVVADYHNDRVCVFRVEDGAFVGTLATRVSYPHDVEEVHGGWLVTAAVGSDTVQFIAWDGTPASLKDAARAPRPQLGGSRVLSYPCALAQGVDGGLFVREHGEVGGVRQFH